MISENDKPDCAVLLAVYNGMKYLEEQLQSILSQTGVNVTVFASVDISTDGSDKWLIQASEKDSRIIVLSAEERFGGAAKNFFRLIKDVDFSRFDYVAFADQDDIWNADKLHKAARIIQYSDYDAYSSNVMAFWSDGKVRLIKKSQPQRQWDYIFEAAGPGCTYLMSVSLMAEIKKCLLLNWEQAQDVSLHDWFCYAFARANNYKWFIDQESSMQYRQHEKNQVGVNTGLKAYQARIKKILSGWWLTQAVLIANLVGAGQTEFIQSWAKLDRPGLIKLARHAFQCRRRKQEQLFFFTCCIVLAIAGRNV